MVNVHINITPSPITFLRDIYKVFTGDAVTTWSLQDTHMYIYNNGRNFIYAILCMNI